MKVTETKTEEVKAPVAKPAAETAPAKQSKKKVAAPVISSSADSDSEEPIVKAPLPSKKKQVAKPVKPESSSDDSSDSDWERQWWRLETQKRIYVYVYLLVN